jgi:hypothetical protein
MGDAGRVERRAGIGDSGGTAIGDVIPGQAHRMKPGPADGRNVLGIGTRRGNVAVQGRSAPRVGNLEVSYGEGSVQQRRDPAEPMVGPGHVEDQIARKQQVGVSHGPDGETIRPLSGPSRIFPLVARP